MEYRLALSVRFLCLLTCLGCVGATALQNKNFILSLGPFEQVLPYLTLGVLTLAFKVLIPLDPDWWRKPVLVLLLALCVLFDVLCGFGQGHNLRGPQYRAIEDAHARKAQLERYIGTRQADLAAIIVPPAPSPSSTELSVEIAELMTRWKCRNEDACRRGLGGRIAQRDAAIAAEQPIKDARERRETIARDIAEKRKALLAHVVPTREPDPLLAEIKGVTGLGEEWSGRVFTILILAILELGVIGGAMLTARPIVPRGTRPDPVAPPTNPPPDQDHAPAVRPAAQLVYDAIAPYCRGEKQLNGVHHTGGTRAHASQRAWSTIAGVSVPTLKSRLAELEASGHVTVTVNNRLTDIAAHR